MLTLTLTFDFPLTRHQQEKFEKTEDCKNCGSPFTKQSPKCRHHNHSTGQFIAAVCNSCNLQLKARRQRIDEKKIFRTPKMPRPPLTKIKVNSNSSSLLCSIIYRGMIAITSSGISTPEWLPDIAKMVKKNFPQMLKLLH